MADPVTETPLVLETGELLVGDQWQWVGFEKTYSDPIVVVKSLSANGSNPAVARVEVIDDRGFWVRVQEWDYLDGTHKSETVGYLVRKGKFA